MHCIKKWCNFVILCKHICELKVYYSKFQNWFKKPRRDFWINFIIRAITWHNSLFCHTFWLHVGSSRTSVQKRNFDAVKYCIIKQIMWDATAVTMSILHELHGLSVVDSWYRNRLKKKNRGAIHNTINRFTISVPFHKLKGFSQDNQYFEHNKPCCVNNIFICWILSVLLQFKNC